MKQLINLIYEKTGLNSDSIRLYDIVDYDSKYLIVLKLDENRYTTFDYKFYRFDNDVYISKQSSGAKIPKIYFKWKIFIRPYRDSTYRPDQYSPYPNVDYPNINFPINDDWINLKNHELAPGDTVILQNKQGAEIRFEVSEKPYENDTINFYEHTDIFEEMEDEVKNPPNHYKKYEISTIISEIVSLKDISAKIVYEKTKDINELPESLASYVSNKNYKSNIISEWEIEINE